MTKFRIDRMAFGQPEQTCLNIQNVPLMYNHADSVNPKFSQSGVYRMNWLLVINSDST